MTQRFADPSRGQTIREQFEYFHATHPEVYDELVKICRQVRARRAHWSIKAAFEVVRYYRMIRPDEGEPFLLNNNYHSYYGRLIMEREPDLAGFFETRTLHEPEPPVTAGGLPRWPA